MKNVNHHHNFNLANYRDIISRYEQVNQQDDNVAMNIFTIYFEGELRKKDQKTISRINSNAGLISTKFFKHYVGTMMVASEVEI